MHGCLEHPYSIHNLPFRTVLYSPLRLPYLSTRDREGGKQTICAYKLFTSCKCKLKMYYIRYKAGLLKVRTPVRIRTHLRLIFQAHSYHSYLVALRAHTHTRAHEQVLLCSEAYVAMGPRILRGPPTADHLNNRKCHY